MKMVHFQHRFWKERLAIFTTSWMIYPFEGLDFIINSVSISNRLVVPFIDMFEKWAVDVKIFLRRKNLNWRSLSQHDIGTALSFGKVTTVPHSQIGWRTSLQRTKWSICVYEYVHKRIWKTCPRRVLQQVCPTICLILVPGSVRTEIKGNNVPWS
jgi:hypothetical protein